jgi:hypothetical protein
MMTRPPTPVAAAAVLVLAAMTLPASAQQISVSIPKAQITLAKAGQGSIRGVVLDTRGNPLAGAMVSALGSSVAFALSGRDGHFLLDPLPMGAYTVRVHMDGYAPSRRHMVEVRTGAPALMSVSLQSLTVQASTGQNEILAAGFAPFDAVPATRTGATPSNGDSDDDHDRTQTAWRLRHLKRSVLKDIYGPVVLPLDVEPITAEEARRFGHAFDASVGPRSSFLSAMPITGQVNLVTTGSVGDLDGIDSPESFTTANVAYIALGAPVARVGQWTMRAAMRQGPLSSWFLSGTYNGKSGAHRYAGGFAYGAQRYEPFGTIGTAMVPGESRTMGTAFATDEWALSRRVSMSYGLNYAWHDYLPAGALLSPRVALTLSPSRTIRLRAVAARSLTAPGAEELLPSWVGDSGAWLPAQRSFAPLSEQQGFKPQMTSHAEFAVERASGDFVVGLRSFFQRVDDQIGTVFSAPTLAHPAASYFVTSVGNAHAAGWGLRVSRPLLPGVVGSVDYSQTKATWDRFSGGAVSPDWLAMASANHLHNLTASVQTDIPRTATRLYILYRVSSAYAGADQPVTGNGLGTRFDVQLNQGLPFMAFTSADWEVLLAVRNLYRDPLAERSVFDELLVLRPPTRIVGGVRVRF